MIRIITDSLCDFTMDYAKENNFDIMPLPFVSVRQITNVVWI